MAKGYPDYFGKSLFDVYSSSVVDNFALASWAATTTYKILDVNAAILTVGGFAFFQYDGDLADLQLSVKYDGLSGSLHDNSMLAFDTLGRYKFSNDLIKFDVFNPSEGKYAFSLKADFPIMSSLWINLRNNGGIVTGGLESHFVYYKVK